MSKQRIESAVRKAVGVAKTRVGKAKEALHKATK